MGNSVGRPSKAEIAQRREKTRELFLKGWNTHKIAKAMGVHYNTALTDIQHIRARYTALIMNNSQLAQRQMARVEQLLDEVGILKERYWHLYEEVEEKVAENKKKQHAWEVKLKTVSEELEQAEKELDETNSKEARMRVRDLLKKFDAVNKDPKYPTYVSARIDTLKAILDRVDKEARLLSIFNPQALIEKNYVSVEVLKSIMEIFKTIIMDMIPEDQRAYAFKRLKTIDIQALNGEEAVEAEFQETRPKKAIQQEDE